MHSIKIAVAAHCFPGPLKLALPAIAQTGARAVQFDARNQLKPSELSETGRRQLLHRLDELGLVVAALSFPTRRTFYDPEQLEARVGALKRVMEFSAQLKSRVVTARIGRIPDDPESEQFAILRDVLDDLCRHGNHVGATLAITPTSDSAAALQRMISAVSAGPIGVNFDPAVFVMSGQDVSEALRTLNDVLIHIQIRDALRDIDGAGLEVPVGRGEVEWDEFLALLDEAAYRGWLTVDRTGGEDRAGDAARAVQYLKQITPG